MKLRQLFLDWIRIIINWKVINTASGLQNMQFSDDKKTYIYHDSKKNLIYVHKDGQDFIIENAQKAILESVAKTKCVVSAEEHMLNGGLGDSIAQCLSRNNPTPIEMVGVNDTFGESGKPKELMAKYGLDSNSIVKAALKVVKRK